MRFIPVFLLLLFSLPTAPLLNAGARNPIAPVSVAPVSQPTKDGMAQSSSIDKTTLAVILGFVALVAVVAIGNTAAIVGVGLLLLLALAAMAIVRWQKSRPAPEPKPHRAPDGPADTATSSPGSPEIQAQEDRSRLITQQRHGKKSIAYALGGFSAMLLAAGTLVFLFTTMAAVTGALEAALAVTILLGAGAYIGLNMAAWYHAAYALRWDDASQEGRKDRNKAITGIVLSAVLIGLTTTGFGLIPCLIPVLFVPKRPKIRTQ